MRDPGEVQRDAVAGTDAVDPRAEGLDRPHPGGTPAGLDHDRVVAGQRPAGERAGHDGAAPLGGEDAVDPQSRSRSIDRLRRRGDQVVERRPQLVETLTGRHRDRHDPRIVQECPLHVVADVDDCQLAALAVDQIDLGEGDDAVTDAQQFEDAEVLLGLRLPPLGRGDHEQAGVDTADTGQHVA